MSRWEQGRENVLTRLKTVCRDNLRAKLSVKLMNRSLSINPKAEEIVKDWKKFEIDCFHLVETCFPDDTYRVEYQPTRLYADGQTKRMDISVAERRQGGNHYVIDCKHWPVAYLNENEIRTTLDYKTRSKASKAIILVSASSNCPEKFIQSASSQGVPVIRVSTVNTAIVKRVKDFFFRREMRRTIL